jgi:hypothetical protein
VLSTLRTLPRDFQPIAEINSAAVKNTLSDVLTSIHGLLGDPNLSEIDFATRELVERYFSYLKNSCTSVKILNIRSAWILNFGKQVQTRLLTLRYAREQKVEYNAADMTTRVDILVNSVINYRLTHKGQIGSDNDMRKLLDELDNLARFVVPMPQNLAYQRLMVDIDTLSTMLNHLVQIGDASLEDEFALIVRLGEIRYQITDYLVHTPFRGQSSAR